MKWITVDNTLVDTEKYRIFKLDNNGIVGASDYSEETETIACFSSSEQAEEAFRDFARALSGAKNE